MMTLTVPAVGLGTWNLTGDDAVDLVRRAVTAGYRHFDTASIYGNEEEVGRGLREAINAGDVTREELFVTTKLWNDDQGRKATRAAFEASRARLGLDYLDCYLIHWPCPNNDRYVESFAEMARLRDSGVLRSIGVSNFYPEALRRLIDETGETPVLNQVERHPGFSQAPLQEVHDELGITTVAWAPLGRGISLMNPVITGIAAETGLSAAQVSLAWAVQSGVAVIPKTTKPERLAENLKVTEVRLSSEQMAAITALDDQPGFGRTFEDPHEVEPEG